MINIVNRVNNEDNVNASHSKGMRFWSPDFILKEFEKLANLGVSTIRISDEMFFLDKRYFDPLLDGLIERDLDLKMWAYSRVDTVRDRFLTKFKEAGIGWLALGIEAGSQLVRQEVSKGTFKEVNIREVCETVRKNEINVISNYIFGFPEDTLETMEKTLNLAIQRVFLELQKINPNWKNEKISARFICALTIYGPGVKTIKSIGKIEGTISKKKKGKNGFGYDPIFIPNGKKITFGQMKFKDKFKIDHRAIAFRKLKKFL